MDIDLQGDVLTGPPLNLLTANRKHLEKFRANLHQILNIENLERTNKKNHTEENLGGYSEKKHLVVRN